MSNSNETWCFTVLKNNNMIRKLFNLRLLSFCALLLALGATTANAQLTILQTGDAAGLTLVTGAANGPHPNVAARFISFSIRNDRPCPVALTNVTAFHPGDVNFGNFRVSANDALYRLYSSSTKLTGYPPPITSANGWKLEATSDTIRTGTTNGKTSIINGISVKIPAFATMRFILECTDTMLMHFDLAIPLTYTDNGVTLISGSGTDIWGGWAPGTTANSAFSATVGIAPPLISHHFIGNVTLEQLAPEPPVANVNLKPAIRCIDDSVKFTATHYPGGTFTWRNKAGTILSQNSTGTFTLTNLKLSDAGRYYVTYTNCGKESMTDSVTLIINNPPAPTVTGKFDYCLNEQFEATIVNGTNPKWYYDAVGGSPVPVTPTINTSTPNQLIYYVTQTDAYGCESSDRTMVRYRAAPKPTRPIVNTPVYYCEMEEADQLTAIGDTLTWYYFPAGGVPTSTAPTPNTSVNDSHQYYVTQKIDGCESDRSRIDVVVVFRPNGLILLDKDFICAGDSIVLNYYGSAFDGAQFNWVLPSSGTTILNGGFDQGPLELRLDSAGKYQVKLTVGFTGCLSEVYSEDVVVKPLPFGNISVKQDVCLGQPELIENINYTSMLDTFIWDFDGGKTTHFTTDQGPYGVYWETPGEKAIKVTYIHNECTLTDIDTITVHPKPSATIVAEGYNAGDQICASDSLKVTVQTVEPGASYKWTPTRFFDTYSDVPVTYARVDFKSKIYVEVEDIYGCQNKDSLEVLTKSCCEMVFPSAFSPNNDGKNDLFRPITLGRREVETFRVVNRYGQTVYESRQSSLGWDGTMNGKPADVGTYFYLISFMCEKEKVDQSGEVILVR